MDISSNNADTLPFTSTFPSVGVKIPVNIFNNVDFPAPFTPSLGAGFNMEYTGIENIHLNGTIMGYSETEIEKRKQEIIDFAEIGEYHLLLH